MAHKVLIVDDDKDTVEIISKRLKEEGYDICQAYDGEEALHKVRECNPDVILLDLTMPKLNGFEVLKYIRQNLTDKWRPVVIISANSELESVKQCYDMEADHYLTKPVTMDALIRGVRTMISLIPARKT